MTTCTTALQSDAWYDGGYIDWARVDQFLFDQYQNLASQVQAGSPIPFPIVLFADMLLTTLELMYGGDIHSRVPPTGSVGVPPGFVTTVFRKNHVENMLEWLIDGRHPPSPATLPGTYSGAAGWWGPDWPGTGFLNPDHHIVYTSFVYMTLRRNRSGLIALGRSFSGLEHKLFPAGSVLDVTGKRGGDLVGLQEWLHEMWDSCGFKPRSWCGNNLDNFWGELVGVVPLFQAMQDVASGLTANNGTIVCQCPALAPTIGMGKALDEAFADFAGGPPGWREREFQPVAGSIATTTFIATSGQQSYASTNPLGDRCAWEAPLPLAPYLGLITSAGSLSAAFGMDWDCSLHQLSRAVLAAHHWGHPFTTEEKELITVRLAEWSQSTCETASGVTAPGCPTVPASENAHIPNERFFWDPGAACGPAQLGATPPDLPTIAVPELAASAAALVRADLFASPLTEIEATSNAVGILQVLATMYRDVGGGAAGWAEADPDPTQNASPSLPGTYFAVLTLMLLADAQPLYAGDPNLPGSSATLMNTYNPSGLPAPAVPEVGLVDFLHVFGSTGPSAKQRFQWAPPPIYVPG